jgi:hypothetical protein
MVIGVRHLPHRLGVWFCPVLSTIGSGDRYGRHIEGFCSRARAAANNTVSTRAGRAGIDKYNTTAKSRVGAVCSTESRWDKGKNSSSLNISASASGEKWNKTAGAVNDVELKEECYSRTVLEEDSMTWLSCGRASPGGSHESKDLGIDATLVGRFGDCLWTKNLDLAGDADRDYVLTDQELSIENYTSQEPIKESYPLEFETQSGLTFIRFDYSGRGFPALANGPVRALVLYGGFGMLLYTKGRADPFDQIWALKNLFLFGFTYQASSFLREGSVEYRPENLASISIHSPWAARGTGQTIEIRPIPKDGLISGLVGL